MKFNPAIIAVILLSITHHIAWCANEILMLIQPQKSYVHCAGEQSFNFLQVVIRIENLAFDKVALVEPRSDNNYGTTNHETPESWQFFLNNGIKKSYPLRWHKKFNFLSEHDELKIYTYETSDGNEDTYLPCKISKDIQSKILLFMTTDQQALNLTSFDFIKTVKFNFINDVPVKDTALFDDGLVFNINESSIKPGDAILFFFTENTSEMTFTIRHFALAIGDNMYLSKLEYGGVLRICSLQTILAFYQCDEYAKINDSAMSNPHFWKMFE